MSNFAYTKRGKTNEILIGAYKEIINAYKGKKFIRLKPKKNYFTAFKRIAKKNILLPA